MTEWNVRAGADRSTGVKEDIHIAKADLRRDMLTFKRRRLVFLQSSNI